MADANPASHIKVRLYRVILPRRATMVAAAPSCTPWAAAGASFQPHGYQP